MKVDIAIRLTLRPFLWAGEGPNLRNNNLPCGYFVDGMPDGQIVQVLNKMASGREPLWQVSYPHLHAAVGEYHSAERALAHLQEIMDEPNGLPSALHKAELAWIERLGHAPESEAAKQAYRNHVEPWKKIVKAQAK